MHVHMVCACLYALQATSYVAASAAEGNAPDRCVCLLKHFAEARIFLLSFAKALNASISRVRSGRGLRRPAGAPYMPTQQVLLSHNKLTHWHACMLWLLD